MKKSGNKATVVLAAAAFAVCSQVQGETRWNQVDPASGSTESAPALAQTKSSVAGSPIPAAHVSIARGVALKGDRFLTAALQLGRPVNGGDMSLKWTPKGTEVEAQVFVCGISAPASPKAFLHPGGEGSCRAIRFAFSQLRYDPAAKQLLLGEHVIARDRGFWQGGLKLEKGFEPVYNIAESRDGRSVTVGLEIARAG